MRTFYLGENTNGVPFIARLVMPGEAYIPGGERKHLPMDYFLGEPLLQFYDARTIPAQMVSSYYLRTLAKGGASGGLDLDGGVPNWFLTEEQLGAALAFATRCGAHAA